MNRIPTLYRPITATPFLSDATYCELPPGTALAPYICCYWGTPNPITPAATPLQETHGLVIPDTCVDIIFTVDHGAGTVTDQFCAIDEFSYRTVGVGDGECGVTSTFAIRFYAWTAILFAEDGLQNSKNRIFPTEAFFFRAGAGDRAHSLGRDYSVG